MPNTIPVKLLVDYFTNSRKGIWSKPELLTALNVLIAQHNAQHLADEVELTKQAMLDSWGGTDAKEDS